MNIREKKEALYDIIDEATKMLKSLRRECPHENGTYEYRGDTGNWSSADDSYWKDMNCHDCGVHWTEDHKIDGMRNDAYHDNPKGHWEEVK